jgi:hypothetical protein
MASTTVTTSIGAEGRNVVAFAAGPSQCGKSRALWDLMVSKFQRRVSFDFVGEVLRFNPQAVRVFSYEEFRRELVKAASRPAWHIAISVDHARIPDIAPKICRLLVPPVTSADRASFSRAVGGICIDCSEADYLAPNGRTTPEVAALFQRGRHDWVSLAMATQHPALVDRQVTNNAQFLLAFQSAESVVLGYWKRTTSAAVAELISELPKFHCAYIVKPAQQVYLLDDERRPYRLLDFKGRETRAPHRPAAHSARSRV